MIKRFLISALLVLSLGASASAQDVKELTTENVKELNDSTHAFVIDFSAVWCGPCRAFAPIYNEVAREMGDKVTFYKVDIDKQKELAQAFNVQAVPTIFIGNLATKKHRVLTGLVDKETLRTAIESVL